MIFLDVTNSNEKIDGQSRQTHAENDSHRIGEVRYTRARISICITIAVLSISEDHNAVCAMFENRIVMGVTQPFNIVVHCRKSYNSVAVAITRAG